MGLNSILTSYLAAHEKYRDIRTEVERDAGSMIRDARNSLDVSLRKFARCIGVEPSYLSKVERGIEPVTPEVARKILRELKGRGAE